MGPPTSSPLRILVVDDEPNIVDVISMALRFQGFGVESAGTGRDALTAVSAFKPHLLLLDVMLPDMEGFEVARRLGAERAGVPIIFLTARDATEDKVRGLTSGGDDYVTKPFSLEELIAAARAAAEVSGSGRAIRPGRRRSRPSSRYLRRASRREREGARPRGALLRPARASRAAASGAADAGHPHHRRGARRLGGALPNTGRSGLRGLGRHDRRRPAARGRPDPSSPARGRGTRDRRRAARAGRRR